MKARWARFGRTVAALFILITFARAAFCDTLSLTDGKEVKGLVVEEHQDRVVLSTADGEREYFRKDIQNIQYDELTYNLLSLGREMENKKRWREALSYYEHALAINPALSEAKQASLGIKSRLWAQMLDEGPQGEISKLQDMHDAWMANVDVDALSRKREESRAKLLWDRLGIKLAAREDWVVADDLKIGGPLQKQGFRRGDALVFIDGKSLRFLNGGAVTEYLLEPRYSNAIIVLRRKIALAGPGSADPLKDLGVRIHQEYAGLTVRDVNEKTKREARSELRDGDLVVEIGDARTRYMPEREALKMFQDPKNAPARLVIHRPITITRK